MKEAFRAQIRIELCELLSAIEQPDWNCSQQFIIEADKLHVLIQTADTMKDIGKLA